MTTYEKWAIIIAGGSRTTYYLAGILAKLGVSVKIIEKDSERA